MKHRAVTTEGQAEIYQTQYVALFRGIVFSFLSMLHLENQVFLSLPGTGGTLFPGESLTHEDQELYTPVYKQGQNIQ